MTTAPVPDPDGSADVERRLDEIANVIQEFAAMRFEARATVGRAGDIVDAVAAGVNSLGEELEASYQEVEHRIADRTAELAIATRELRRRALHDDLTGLANRAAFWDRLAHRLRAAHRRGTGLAVLFLDVDDFKKVNDTFGHIAADRLLVEMTRRITSELRAGDTAARVGGDEFLVLLDEVATDDAALAVARRLTDRLREPYDFGTHHHPATTSIGVALRSDDLATPDAIVAAADAAMYDAKRRGGGLSVLHSRERHGASPIAGPAAGSAPEHGASPSVSLPDA